MEVERQKVERHDKIYTQQETALEQHCKQLEIEERQVQEIQIQNEMKIMETDTTSMDSIYATYWNNLKIEVSGVLIFSRYLLCCYYFLICSHYLLCCNWN